MPTIHVAHANPEIAEPLAQALIRAGWKVRRSVDGAGALLAARQGVAAVLVADPVAEMTGFELATRLQAAQPGLPVVVLAKAGTPELEAHRSGPATARAYLDFDLAPEVVARELLRAVRTVPGTARPTSGAQAVTAALRELDALGPNPVRPPPEAPSPPAPEGEKLHQRIRELELEKLALSRSLAKLQDEKLHAVSARDDMLRHLQLALEALTVDLSNAATGLAEQQDRAGNSETQLSRVQSELALFQQQLATEVSLAHELRRELGEARGQLLAAELDGLALREALSRAVDEARAGHERATASEAQLRDERAHRAHDADARAQLQKKLVAAEAALEKPRTTRARSSSK